MKGKDTIKDLATEDYTITPISVLRYLTELESNLEKASILMKQYIDFKDREPSRKKDTFYHDFTTFLNEGKK